MTGTVYFLIAIAVSAVITFGLRALPFVLFRGGRSMPDWMKRLGQILPSERYDVNEEWAHSGIIKAGDFCYLGYCVGII